MNDVATRKQTCWSISDGHAGNERQTLALAQALGLEPRQVRVRLRQPWAALAPRLLRHQHHQSK